MDVLVVTRVWFIIIFECLLLYKKINLILFIFYYYYFIY